MTKESSMKQRLYVSKWRSRGKGMSFGIDFEYAKKLFEDQNEKCAISGIPIDFALGRRDHSSGETTASLDRIDSSKGYIKGNVQWVHKSINVMKNELKEDIFFEFCLAIVKYNGLN